MKKLKIILLYFVVGLLISPPVFSQEADSLLKKINILKEKNEILQKNYRELLNRVRTENKKFENSIDSVQNELSTFNKKIADVGSKLSSEISRADSSSNNKYSTLDKTLANTTIYWVIGLALVFLIAIMIFYFLRKKMRMEKNDLDLRLIKTRKELEEEGIKLDNKLVEILNTQLYILKTDKKTTTMVVNDVDHSLPLKIADEITRIEKNLSNMDSSIKGFKQLKASVDRIKDNFIANGYELIDMLNKPYDPGLKVIANFRPDENLKKGEQIITRIIKPQVNYRGTMIQAAQIEVTQGE